MTWQSERLFSGGVLIYEPLKTEDRFLIIYRHPVGGDFVRGVISYFEMMQARGEK